MSRLAIIDLGTTSVGLALVQRPGGKIIFSDRVEAPFAADGVDPARFMTAIMTALKEVLNRSLKSAPGAPEEVVCFLSGPFYASATRIIKKSDPKKLMITPETINSWVEEGAPNLPANHEWLEDAVLELLANGYPIARPSRQVAEEIELYHFTSYAPQEILAQLRQVIGGAFHHEKISFHSFVYALYRSLAQCVANERNLLLLDLGGELAELSLVWHGVLRETVSFPEGRNWLIRQVAAANHTTPAEAYSALKLLASNERQPGDERLVQALAAAKEEWTTKFKQALDQVLQSCFIPERILSFGDPALVPIYQNWLEGLEHLAPTLGNRHFKSAHLTEAALDKFCDQAATVRRDFSLMVEAVFCDTLKTN